MEAGEGGNVGVGISILDPDSLNPVTDPDPAFQSESGCGYESRVLMTKNSK
jgi:hypothetical protein